MPNVARTRVVVVAYCLLFICSLASAQSDGSIAGTARDTTGAVLPGVTVEAASPALIEKVRTVVTDGQGAYKIVDLRPGTYSVTFTLPGFGTYKREGIELRAGFTATVNGDLKIGSIEETVTVTGASPLVDVQSTRTQQVFTADVLDSLPSGSKNFASFASLTLGARGSMAGQNDVGGDKGEFYHEISLHGLRGGDGKAYLDGFNMNVGAGGGMGRTYYFNDVGVQETVIDTGGNTAESESGGSSINLVPKDGGNAFRLSGRANYTNKRFSAKGIPDNIAARGVTAQSSLKEVADYGVGIGGPIVTDRLWFYAANRWWWSQNFGIGNYFNKSQNNFVYEPDLTRPAHTDAFFRDNSVRLTWQVNTKHKIASEVHVQHGCLCWGQVTQTVAPDANINNAYGPHVPWQTTWTYPATNRLLFSGGLSWFHQNTFFPWMYAETANKFTATGPFRVPTTIGIIEQVGIPARDGRPAVPAGYMWGALTQDFGNIYARKIDTSNRDVRFAGQYVTGSHAFKTGARYQHIINDRVRPGDIGTLLYTFRAGVPASLTQIAAPFNVKSTAKLLGIYAQDQWRMARLTLSLGIRYDGANGSTPALTVPAGPFIPERSVPAASDLPNFKDITPRLGASYDLFGNGRTAIKGAWGRYLSPVGVLSQFAPGSIVSSVTRTWNDSFFPVGDPRRANFVPDCELTNNFQNAECGTLTNLAFGQTVNNSSIADNAREGWNTRFFSDQFSLQLQHELRPGFGVAVGYFRTSYGNARVTKNTLTDASDYTEYCITAPTDARLGASSGKQICGLYNVNPNKFGQSFSRTVLVKDEVGAEPIELYNGVDMAFNARWGKGALLTGGVTVGRQTWDNCYANSRPDITSVSVNYPRVAGFCDVTSPWWQGIGSQVKLQAVYPLPLDFVISGTFKSIPGIPVQAAHVLTNAQVAPSLGRNMSACPAVGACNALAVVTVLPAAGSAFFSITSAAEYDERLNQTDLRLTKLIRFGSRRLSGMLDVYNVFNARTPEAANPIYGATWLRPTSLLGGRLLKFGAQIDW